jgi:RHS repeat-associated protein
LYRYKFNGKELDGETETQDYGMRIYNAALGRFLSVDPYTNKYPMLSTYQFASNRPIEGVDLDGKEYIDSKLATDEFFAQIGITFCDDLDKQSFIQANTKMFKGESYLKLGFHVYQNETGAFSTKAAEGFVKISKWIYTDIRLILENTKVYTWGDKTVKGSQPFKQEDNSTKQVPNNENCVVLSESQARQNGDNPTGPFMAVGNTQTSVDAAEDYINKQLEANHGIVIRWDNFPTKNYSGDAWGSDHSSYIYGRTTDADGNGVWLVADNMHRVARGDNGVINEDQTARKFGEGDNSIRFNFGPAATVIRTNKESKKESK